MEKNKKKSENRFDKTKVIIVAIIVAGIGLTIIAVRYIDKGEKRPVLDFKSNGDVHIERKK